jgi:hypothetical protein
MNYVGADLFKDVCIAGFKISAPRAVMAKPASSVRLREECTRRANRFSAEITLRC